ncbi:MAG: F0F1 ATP synthase subunit B [Acidimicrobiia bacterium]|nr:F0F1 ATP synthase subunit B [Acidimicrobiia bacterium]
MPEELTLAELLALGEAEEGEAVEEEAEEEVPNPVLPTGNEILWAAVFFFALWAMMKYVLLPPIQRTRAERAAKISEARDAAGNASADIATAQADYDATINAARSEATSLVDAARAEADADRAEVMAAAEAEVATLRANAETELAEARATAMSALRDDVAAVAVGAASTVVGRDLDASSHRSIVDRILDGGDA